MIYESALSFGKNASIINEAYEKIYSSVKSRPSKRMAITEANNREDVSDDFIFSDEHWDSTKAHRYPDWLRNAAKKAGHTLPNDDKIPQGFGTRQVYVQSSRPSEQENIPTESPEQSLWDNIVKEHPEVFNDENYDMSKLADPSNIYEFYKKCKDYLMKGYDEVEAAKLAFEEIPGCESKEIDISYYDTEDDSVGMIDEPDETDGGFENIGVSNYGYGIVVKNYVKDYVPGEKFGYSIEWVTPDEFKEQSFNSLENAKDALRKYMQELIEVDPTEICVGSIIDRSISSKMFNNSSTSNGNVNPVVYSISTSDAKTTDRAMKYANNNNFRKNIEPCDEYLQ